MHRSDRFFECCLYQRHRQDSHDVLSTQLWLSDSCSLQLQSKELLVSRHQKLKCCQQCTLMDKCCLPDLQPGLNENLTCIIEKCGWIKALLTSFNLWRGWSAKGLPKCDRILIAILIVSETGTPTFFSQISCAQPWLWDPASHPILAHDAAWGCVNMTYPISWQGNDATEPDDWRIGLDFRKGEKQQGHLCVLIQFWHYAYLLNVFKYHQFIMKHSPARTRHTTFKPEWYGWPWGAEHPTQALRVLSSSDHASEMWLPVTLSSTVNGLRSLFTSLVFWCVARERGERLETTTQ